jgi:arylsulfatase A-like enzyme
MSFSRSRLFAYLSVLLGAGAFQSVVGGTVQQWVEGWGGGAAVSIFQATLYLIPAVLGFGALVVLARAASRIEVHAFAAVGAATLLAAPLLVVSAYAAFQIIGIATVLFSVWGAAIVSYIALRFGVPMLSRPQLALALVPGWLVTLPVLVSMERKYQLLAAMSEDLFDPNALLLCLLALLTLLAGAALAHWFAAADDWRSSRWHWAIAAGLLVGWGGLVWANRAVIVPRLYPEVHAALAFFELVMLLGALGWLLRGWLDGFDFDSKHAVLIRAIPAILAACGVLLFIEARPNVVVPRAVDYTASFFSQPWLWAFDRDGDGFLHERLGGIDCGEGEAGINPLGREVAGDGVDQTCSGADLDEKRAAKAGEQTAQYEPGLGVDLAIVVSIDMLRPDFMGVYGSDDQTTPFLSETADQWTRFDNAYTSGGITTLALPSLLKGRIPLAIDFEPVLRTTDLRYVFPDERDDGDVVNRVFAAPRSDRHPTLGEVFQEAGRSTYGVVDDGPAAIFQKGLGFERGFDTFSFPNAPEGPGKEAWGAREVTDAAIEASSKAPQGSLMWLHYYDPHAANSEYCDKFGPTPGLGCYRDAIRHVDQMLGEFVAHLRQTGRWERTLMIVTSDHGEALGEHGLRHHGLESYEEFARIPMLLKTPGDDHPRTSDAAVSLIDATVTLVAAAGLTPPATFQGDDLRVLARGESRRYPVVSQMLITGVDGRPVRQQNLLVDGTSRYMHDRITERSWLFDLADDPEQMRPLDGRGEYRRELLDLLDVLERRTSYSRKSKFP